ncbi:TPR domain-containing protein [Diaporthe helianthi]|uniref:TPR domain-containing protein n=1 Tax=Diaporthe helianthi TaxID=158607 RepID=A0A2P5I0P9_DIAHE|nr:TPR domain-containing protein [Diaporthe helianthi]
MAPTKPSKKAKAKNRSHTKKASAISTKSAKQLLAEATALLEQGDATGAVTTARAALSAALDNDDTRACAAHMLLGEINVELGEIDTARSHFLEAARLDEDGSLSEELGGGPEKFNWLAQLSEDGGADSVGWFERAAACLRAQIQVLGAAADGARRKGSAHGTAVKEIEDAISEKKKKLSETLCAVAEVYMTDLSWEEDAEARCEALITEATMLAPELPDAWQTVADVRVSQSRRDDAVAALERSMALWTDLEPEDPGVPPFPSRVSLTRLLIECDLQQKAVQVCDRLVLDDDGSVEAWYLGGMAHYTLGEKGKLQASRTENGDKSAEPTDSWKKEWVRARQWLSQCLLLFEAQEYEDERLGEHAKELLDTVNAEVGELPDDDDDDDDDDDGAGAGWEDVDKDDDEDMDQA